MNNKGTLKWLIACDESGIGGAEYYGYGSLWMKWQRRGDFYREINEILQRWNYSGELKWQKCNDRKKLAAHKELIEYFFKRHWLAFHCIIIRKGVVDKTLHKGDYDLARRKHFIMLISNKIKKCIESHSNQKSEFRVWVDKIPSRYSKADEEVEVVGNNILKKELLGIRPIHSVITKDSKLSYQIQLCDLLLGCVMDAWQGKASSKSKLELQEYLANYLGWNDLKADTPPSQRKFNIWYFYDNRFGKREIETRKVKLLYPLPSNTKSNI